MRSDPARARLTRGWLYAGLAMNPLVILGTMAATGGRGTSAGFGSAPVIGYALTQCGAVWMYLGKILWPQTLVLDHGDRLATLATAWPWLVLTLMALAALAVGFWRRPRIFFPAVAAVLLLAPSSSVVPVKTQTVAEHRVYLASAAVVGLMIAAAFAAARRIAPAPRPGSARGCDDMREFAAAAAVWEPLAAADAALLANLAVSRIEAGQIEGAIDAFRRAVEAFPDDPGMRQNLARALALAAERSTAPKR